MQVIRVAAGRDTYGMCSPKIDAATGCIHQECGHRVAAATEVEVPQDWYHGVQQRVQIAAGGR